MPERHPEQGSVAEADAATPAALRQQGLRRLQSGVLPEAIQMLSRAVALDPNDATAQLNLGLALQRSGRHIEAAETFRTCQAKLPNDPAPWLNRAVSLLALGDTATALRDASEACYRAPDRYETHYTYGLAWLAANEPRRAEQAFAAALRVNRRFADGWVNLGVARYRQDNIEGAKEAMRQALAHAPGHPAATANLGAFMRISGESEGAEVSLRETIAREPTNAGARLNLAADLLQEERAEEALELLDAVPVPPDVRQRQHWLLQRSLALLQLNRPTEAEAALRQLGQVPATLAPLLQWRQIMLALAAGDRVQARDVAAKMEATLRAQGDAVLPEHRIMARYDLAKFWSGQREHSRAFANWTAAHKLLARSQPFSRADHLAFVEASISSFDRARFACGPRAANSDPAPIFIVGMPRSGTTLCEQILAGHQQAHGAGERTALGAAFFALGGRDTAEAVQRAASLDADTLDRAAATYLTELHALAPDKTRIVDKMPGNFNYLGLVGLMLPDAKIIHCARDPRDIGLSIFTFRFYGSHGYAHDLRDLGWYIGQHDRLMAHWKAVMPNSILTVQLSDWVRDFDRTLAKVLAHVGLPHDPNCARFYEREDRVRTVSRAQVREPVNARGLGRWRAYADELAPLVAELEEVGSLAAWRDDRRPSSQT
jgi:tetratricopeptide (TPR) repeat protein